MRDDVPAAPQAIARTVGRGSGGLAEAWLWRNRIGQSGGKQGKSEPLHAQANTRQIAESGSYSAVRQIIVEREHGCTGVDANDVAAYPVSVQINVAESVAAVSAM